MANTITVGALTDLQVKIPVEGTSGWATDFRNEFVRKIVEHNHSGENGQGRKIGAGSLAADIVTDQEIRLRNDEFLRARNAADDGDVDILKVNGSDVIELASALVSLDVTNNVSIGGSLNVTGDTTSNTLKLTPISVDPTSPVEGQVQYSDGTARAEGIYVYSESNWLNLLSTTSDKVIQNVSTSSPSDTVTINTGTQLIFFSNSNPADTTGTLILPDADTVPGRTITIVAEKVSDQYKSTPGLSSSPEIFESETDWDFTPVSGGYFIIEYTSNGTGWIQTISPRKICSELTSFNNIQQIEPYNDIIVVDNNSTPSNIYLPRANGLTNSRYIVTIYARGNTNLREYDQTTLVASLVEDTVTTVYLDGLTWVVLETRSI